MLHYGLVTLRNRYLHETCPTGLRASAMTIFRHLATVDPDAVWYLLMKTCAPAALPAPPAAAFVAPVFPPARDGFTTSVDELLRLIQ